MLYIPDRVWELGDGKRLFLLFQDTQNKVNSIDLEVSDKESQPTMALDWDDGEISNMTEVMSEIGHEVYSQDFRVNCKDNGEVCVTRRICSPENYTCCVD